MSKFEGPKSAIDKIVVDLGAGEKAPATRAMVETYLGEKFADQKIPDLEGLERPPKPEELKIFAVANRVTNEVLARYGADPFDIPAANVHPILASKWQKFSESLGLTDSNGAYDYRNSSIAYREETSQLLSVDHVIHEMTHFKAFQSLDVEVDRETGVPSAIAPRRLGLESNLATEDGDFRMAFRLLDEAVTVELELRALSVARLDPVFKAEVGWNEAFLQRHPECRRDDLVTIKRFTKAEQALHPDSPYGLVRAGYERPRAALEKIIGALYRNNQDVFQSREEFFGLFAKAALTGKMLVLARVIEKTFGPGAFRRLGECQNDVELEKFVQGIKT